MSAPRRPSFTDLVNWVEGRLPEQRAEEVAAHVESHAQLQESVAWIHRFLALAADAPLVQPPEKVRAALRATFREGARSSDTTTPRRLVLLFDSRRDHVTSGVRAVDADTGIHLAYTGDAVDIVIDVYHGPRGAARIEGQLLLRATRPTVAVVTLRDADGEVARLSVNDPLGRFTLDEVRAGPTELCARVDDVELCADLDLSRSPDEL